jgi:hypothetical protein
VVATDDPAANKLVLAAISHKAAQVRATAIETIVNMSQARHALNPLLVIAAADQENLRLRAFQVLVSIADENNKATIRKTLIGMRYDNSPTIREAVEAALRNLAGQ